MNLENLIAPIVETALNTYLSLDPDVARRLRTISGRLIALEIKGVNAVLLVRPLEDKIRVSLHTGVEPDVVISGSPLALARLGFSKKATDGSLGEDIQIRGDAELGRIFREVLAGVEIDWEEMLAMRVGDIPAHQAGNWVRSLTAGFINILDKLRMDVSEYLQEESRIVPTRLEIEQFMDEVDGLRAEVDRLEARIERLGGIAPETTLNRPKGG